MADALPLSAYLKAAFHFRPFGMFVAPNWVALGVAGLLGLVNPGFWLLGLAGEGIYLLTMVATPRFRALVDAHHARNAPAARAEDARLAALPAAARERYARLRATAEAIVAAASPDEPDVAREDRARLLERMSGVHLALLASRDGLVRALASEDPELARRLTSVRDRLATLPAGELHDSLADQAAVLAARAEAWDATRARLAWIDAELGRVEEHVGLLRDRALLRNDPGALGAEVDRLTELLAGADRWLQEHARLDAEPPAEPPRLRPPERATR